MNKYILLIWNDLKNEEEKNVFYILLLWEIFYMLCIYSLKNVMVHEWGAYSLQDWLMHLRFYYWIIFVLKTFSATCIYNSLYCSIKYLPFPRFCQINWQDREWTISVSFIAFLLHTQNSLQSSLSNEYLKIELVVLPSNFLWVHQSSEQTCMFSQSLQFLITELQNSHYHLKLLC